MEVFNNDHFSSDKLQKSHADKNKKVNTVEDGGPGFLPDYYYQFEGIYFTKSI